MKSSGDFRRLMVSAASTGLGWSKKAMRQPKRGFHVKGGLGREPLALHQFGHARHVRFKCYRDILCTHSIYQKLKRSCFENGGSLGGVSRRRLHIRLSLPVGRGFIYVVRLALAAVPGSRISPAGLTHKVGLHAIVGIMNCSIIDEAMLAFGASVAPWGENVRLDGVSGTSKYRCSVNDQGHGEDDRHSRPV
jgi:hypothetical protein